MKSTLRIKWFLAISVVTFAFFYAVIVQHSVFAQEVPVDAGQPYYLPLVAGNTEHSVTDPSLEVAVEKARALFEELAHPGLVLKTTRVVQDGNFVVAYVEDAAEQVAIGSVLLGEYSPDLGWNVAIPVVGSSRLFEERLERFPVSLLDEADKWFYSMGVSENVESSSTENYSGHKLPWQAGAGAVVTQKDNASHVNQIDFVIDGQDSAGVYASKPGWVRFVKVGQTAAGACDSGIWRTANLIVIEHQSGEFSWYMHLKGESPRVSVGQWVEFGHRIGTQGKTGYVCPISGTGIHLHYLASSGHTDWTNSADLNALPSWTGAQAVDFQEYSWSQFAPDRTTRYISQNSGGNGACSVSGLNNPSDGATVSDRNIEFRWSGNCSSATGYTLRIKTVSDMNSGGETLYDSGVSSTSQWFSIPSQYDNRDLYWSVKVAPTNNWVSSRRFRVSPGSSGGCGDPGSTEIIVYADSNYGGTCKKLGIGDYTSPGAFSPVGNDQISSIRVGSSARGILCEHDSYQGTCETFTGDDSNLSGNSIGDNSASSIKVENRSVQPPSAPTLSSPSNGAVIEEGASINLSWSGNASEYYGEITGGPGGTLNFNWQSGTSKDIGSQWAGYVYSWRILARNSAGSTWSSSRTFTVRPASPGNVAGSAASCSVVNLTWTDRSGSEEGYRVVRDGFQIATLGAGVTTYRDNGPGSGYGNKYEVYAYRGSVNSAYVAVTVNVPNCPTLPSTPSLISPANGAILEEKDPINLAWSGNGNEYYGEISGGPGGTLTFAWQSGTSKNIGTQWAGYEYSWRIKARNGNGEGNWSLSQTFVVTPNPPATVTAIAPACQVVTISWSDSSGMEEGYVVYRNGVLLGGTGRDGTSFVDNNPVRGMYTNYEVHSWAGSYLSRPTWTSVIVPPAALCDDKESSDMDGDGKSDILWRNSRTGENILYRMNGARRIGAASLPTIADANWRVAGTGDFNGDRRADILWRHVSTGQMILYFMSGGIATSKQSVGTVADLNWQIAGIGDFSGDGKSDILWRNMATGSTVLWRMNGSQREYVTTIRVLGTEWHVAGIDDFNGDGWDDILWRNMITGRNYMYLMEGAYVKGNIYLNTVPDQLWKVVGTGDFDGDGLADILWRHFGTGTNHLYLMNWNSVRKSVSINVIADMNWRVAGTGDFNGDGKSDIVWRNTANGVNYLYQMNWSLYTGATISTVADQNWKIVGLSNVTWPGGGVVAAAESGDELAPSTNGVAEVGAADMTSISESLPEAQPPFETPGEDSQHQAYVESDPGEIGDEGGDDQPFLDTNEVDIP